MNDDERAIRELVTTWMAATKTGDLETVLNLMTDDVVFLVPGHEPFGKAEFAAASKGMKGMQFDGTSDIAEIQILDNWAWMRNHLKIAATPPGGATIIREGETLTILEKRNGKWLIARDANLLSTKK